MLGSLIPYIKGMRILMFQLSGFYSKCKLPKHGLGFRVQGLGLKNYQNLRLCSAPRNST